MDIIKFNNPTRPTLMEDGEIVNGFTSKMWIERYDEAGNFEFKARLSSGVREKLPIGTFVSHIDTHELAVVEDHQIEENEGEDPTITITGRGFEAAILSRRVIGMDSNFPKIAHLTQDYPLITGYTWNQIATLINDHTRVGTMYDHGNEIDDILVRTLATPKRARYNLDRKVKRGTNLYNKLVDLLRIDGFGIKIIRPGVWTPFGSTTDTVIALHLGVDRTKEVIFSHDLGEIINADYLWSDRNYKNACYVTGKWTEVVSTPIVLAGTGLERRWMWLDASDLDDNLDVAPVEPDASQLATFMMQRGAEALLKQKKTALTKAEIAKTGVRSHYRKDYDVGDYITVVGNYDAVATMKVTEYVEIEDENGEQGYPTLTGEVDAADG